MNISKIVRKLYNTQGLKEELVDKTVDLLYSHDADSVVKAMIWAKEDKSLNEKLQMTTIINIINQNK